MLCLLIVGRFLLVMFSRIGRDPVETEVLMLVERGRETLNKGDAEAIREIERTLARKFKKFADNSDLCIMLMRARLALDDAPGTIQTGETGITYHADDFDIQHLLAKAYALNGNYENAYRSYSRLKSKSIASREIRSEYATVGRRLWEAKATAGDEALKSGDPDKAVEMYTKAAFIAWDLREAVAGRTGARLHFANADIYRKKGDTRRAIQAYRSGLRSDPWRPGKQLEAARLEEEAGMANAAILHYRASLKIDPEHDEVEKTTAAIRTLESKIRTKPGAISSTHRGTIYILPLGDVDMELLKEAASHGNRVLGCKFDFLDRQDFPEETRMEPSGRYDADRIHEILQRRYHDFIDENGILGVIAVCKRDLGLRGFDNPLHSWSRDRLSVLSYDRLADPPYDTESDDEELLRRATVQLVMSSGTVLGVDYCENVPCAMACAGTVDKIQFKEPSLCERCKDIFDVLAKAEEWYSDSKIERLAARVEANPEDSLSRRELRQYREGRREHFNKLIEAMKELLGDFPDDTNVFYVLAGLYLRNGRYEDARATFRNILELNPTHFDAKRRLEIAEEHLRKAVNVEPG